MGSKHEPSRSSKRTEVSPKNSNRDDAASASVSEENSDDESSFEYIDINGNLDMDAVYNKV